MPGFGTSKRSQHSKLQNDLMSIKKQLFRVARRARLLTLLGCNTELQLQRFNGFGHKLC